MSGGAQHYCLRWNNHRSNLLTVFDELLQNEAFTDVTLACDGGTSVKCHKMVLAACSSYFQTLFTELPCRHPVVVLKDVKYTEIKAILEYMYRGEVNVAQNQLAALLKVAEALKVKGLVEEKRVGSNSESNGGTTPTDRDFDRERERDRDRDRDRPVEHGEDLRQHSPPTISTSSMNIQSAAHSSSSGGSPPHSTAMMNGPSTYGSKSSINATSSSPYGSMYGKSSSMLDKSRLGLPMWAVPGVPLAHHGAAVSPQSAHHNAAAAMLGSYDAINSDMSPLKRKKLSSLLMNRDTPILRTVLGQGQADSSQPVSLVCHPDSHENLHSNGSFYDEKVMKNEPSEDAQSPYTDISMIDEDEKPKLGVPSSSPLSFGDMRGVSSGIATYVPQQKPEWKRYKQYTRNDIMSAIEAVRNGMSALQAARKYGVPSRTLYDKVKKLGITTSRPFKRGSNGSSACFPYGLSGTSSPYGGHTSDVDDTSHAALLEASFLQHALDSRAGAVGGGDVGDREALVAMAAAAAAHHAAAAGNSTSPGNHGMARSPSPGPGLAMSLSKYMRPNSLTPSPADGSEHHHSETNGSSERDRDEDDDQVEDLSMTRKQDTQQSQQQQQQSPHEQSRVIMPPMNQVSTIMKKDDTLKEGLRDEPPGRREIKVENNE